jgi:hypothetical protein
VEVKRMNKKILIISILAVFMLLAIVFTTTVTSNTQKPPKQESPLFGIRTRRAIREKIGDLMRRFVGERKFFLPFFGIINKFINNEDFSIGDPYNSMCCTGIRWSCSDVSPFCNTLKCITTQPDCD